MQLENKNKDLIRINSDLDNFIYTASHDLKAPVSNIEGLINTLSETLQENGMVNDEITEFLEMINKSVKKFQGTIKDLASLNESQRTDNSEMVSVNFSEANW